MGWKKLTYGKGAFLENLSKCANCMRGRPQAACAFLDWRVIDGQKQQISFLVKPDPQSPEYPQVFNRPITSTDIELKARACAKVLLPVLLKEQAHCRQPNLIRRPRELLTRAICDTCQAGLFALSWFCPTCGQDFCTDCVEDMRSCPNMENAKCISKSDLSHDRLSLRPVTRFQQDELHKLIERMTLDAEREELPRFQSQEHCQAGAPSEVPRHSNQNLKVSDFLHEWSRGIPVVITNVLLQGTWGPQYFIDAFGEEVATIVNCETGQTKKVKVKEYFGWFLNSGMHTGIWKLKDWPPPAEFSGIISGTIRCFLRRCSLPRYCPT